MRYHNITQDDMLNGDGLRTVLWVSGCAHRCRECHNPITWDRDGGIPFDEAAEEELFEKLSRPYISGVTFSGGDPLLPDNRGEIARLIRRVREELPQKTVWLYTGYEWKDICTLPLLADVDVLVDGKYVAELRDTQLHWRGSSNQHVIDVRRSLQSGKIILWESDDIPAAGQAELLLRDSGSCCK